MDTTYTREAFKIMIDAWCIRNKYKLEYANRPYDNPVRVFRFKVYGPGCMKTYYVDFNQMDNIYECMNSVVTDFSKFTLRGKLETSTIYGVTTPSIRNVYFNYPYVIVMWTDKTKTMVKCGEDDFYDPEKGLALAISKKFLGTNKNKSNYYEVFKKWLGEYEEKNKADDSLAQSIFEKFKSSVNFKIPEIPKIAIGKMTEDSRITYKAKDRAEAESIVDSLDSIIKTYGHASYSDFNDIVGLISVYKDTKVGWLDLRDTKITGCEVTFPPFTWRENSEENPNV